MSVVPIEIFEWTPLYAVRVAEIDREHQFLFGVVNRLHQAMLAGKGRDILGVLLAETTQYTAYHFANEEKLMADIQYPGLPAHVREHDDLRSRIMAFAKRFEHGETTVTIQLSVFYTAWLKQHTMTTDRRLGQYVIGSEHAPASGRARA